MTPADLPPTLEEGLAEGVAARNRRRRQRLLVGFLVVMILGYARQIVSSPTVGQDFRAFFAAATVVAQHGSPYNWGELASTEDRLYNQPGGLTPGRAAYYDFLPYPEGPWLAFVLLPLTGLSWPLAYAIFAIVVGLILLAAAFTVFTELRWPVGRARIAVGCTVLSAIGFINLFTGQVSVIVFGASVAAWVLARRGHPLWAGVVLAIVWIKPNIGLPLPLVLVLMEPAGARRMIAAFAVTTAAAFGLAAAALGAAFFDWPLQALRMWQSVQGVQPDIASVESFYYPALSGWLKTAALGVTLLLALAYGRWAVGRARDPQTRGLTVLLVWLAALPFVQSYDLILLLPAIAVLLGPRLDGWHDPLVEVSLWSFLIIPLAYFIGLRLGYFNGFSAIPLTLLVMAWHRRVLTERPPARVTAVAA